MPMKGLAAAVLVAITLVPQVPRFKARVDAVQIDALVTDRRRPVAGLGPGDFELRDNGVAQRIERVGAQDVALEIILLLDTSSSVIGKPLSELKRAAAASIQSLRPGLDRASVMAFSHQITFAAALTDDRELLARRIDGFIAGGGTSMLDALAAGLMLRQTSGTRRLLLVYTDGLDTFSWLAPEEVVGISERADSVIYFVTTGKVRIAFASELAEATGGAYLNADNISGVRDSFAKVVAEFRNRYLLTYYPDGVEHGGWHQIDVSLKGRKGNVQARRGYQGD